MKTIETRISGIPCLVRVDAYTNVSTWPSGDATAPSDLDYYGYTEVEFTVLDRNGREAPWLEKKMYTEDERRIVTEIIEEMGA